MKRRAKELQEAISNAENTPEGVALLDAITNYFLREAVYVPNASDGSAYNLGRASAGRQVEEMREILARKRAEE